MIRRLWKGLSLGAMLLAAPAWALSDGDVGGAWVGAPTSQKIQLVNILSRELNVDPGKLQQCIEKSASDPANAGTAIRDLARQCAESLRN